MALTDYFKRGTQIFAEGFVDYGKQYLTSASDLVNDAAEIKDNVIKGGKTVGETIAKFKSDHGNPIKGIQDWFFGRSSQYEGFDDADSEFDAGFGDDNEEEGGQASVLDKDSMKSISNAQVGAMYQIGSKQVEANTANTASIVTTINNRASEMIASMTAINTSIIAVGNKLDNIAKLLGSAEADKKKTSNVNGIIRSDGNFSVSGLATQMFESLKNSDPGSIISLLPMFLQGGPSQLASMGFDWLGSKIKVKGKSINDWGTFLNETISSTVNGVVEKLISPNNSRGGIFGKIAEFFGLDDINTKYNRDYRNDVKNGFNTEKAVFDGITRHSIISIIPGYLKEITHALTGKNLSIDPKGNLTTKSGDYFGQAVFKGAFGMVSSQDDTIRENIIGFSKAEAREAEKQMINGFAGATIILDRASFVIGDQEIKQLGMRIALQSFEKSNANTRSLSDWKRCLDTIYGNILSDDVALNRFRQDVNKRISEFRKNAENAASSNNPIISANARRLNEDTFSDYGAAHINDISNTPQELSHEAKREIEKLEKELERVTTTERRKRELEKKKQEIIENDYEKQQQDVTIKTVSTTPMTTVVTDILRKLYDVIDVRIVDRAPSIPPPDYLHMPFYGSSPTVSEPDTPESPSEPETTKKRKRRRRRKKSNDSNTGQVSDVRAAGETPTTEEGTPAAPQYTEEQLRELEANAASGVDKAVSFISNVGQAVAGSREAAAVTGAVKKVKAFIQSPRAAIKAEAGNVWSDIKNAAHNAAGDAQTRVIAAAGMKSAQERIQQGGISAVDQQHAAMARSLMSAALSDGDGKSDLQAIKSEINKIENAELRGDLSKAITQMINNSDSKIKEPAKSKLGKILLWAGAGLKTLFAPVIKIVKSIGSVIGKGFKSVGKLLLRYFAGAAAKAKAGVEGIKTGLFGAKDKDGNVTQKGLFANIADYRAAKKAEAGGDAAGGKSLGTRILDTVKGSLDKITGVFTNASGWFGKRIESLTEKLGSGKGPLGKFFSGLGAATDENGNKVSFMDRVRQGTFGQSAFGQSFFGVFDKAKEYKADYAKKIAGLDKPKTMADQQSKEIKEMLDDAEGKKPSLLSSIYRLLVHKFEEDETDKAKEEEKKNQDPNTGEVGKVEGEGAEGTKGTGEGAGGEGGAAGTEGAEGAEGGAKVGSGLKGAAEAAGNALQGGGGIKGAASAAMSSLTGGGGVAGALKGIMGSLGSIAGGVVALGGAALQVIAGMSGMKKIMNIVTEILTEGLAPINDVLEGLYKMVKPVIKVLSTTIKALITPITETLKVVIDVVGPILDFLGKILIEPLNVITNIIAPTVSIIGNAVKVIVGVLSTGMGYVLKILGAVGMVLGGIQKVLTFGGAGNAVTALAEGFSTLGDVLIGVGKQWFSEGITGIKDSVAEIASEINDYIASFSDDDSKSSDKERLFAEETFHGSAMDGLMGSGDTYNNYNIFKNMYGSGNTSQVSYGTYMNMKDHGCGPVALADAYSRRTGGSINPVALTKSMSGSGNYNSSRGTSLAGMINTGRALGMNMTPGGVTYNSIRHASPHNPITLMGSGDGFGTRNGNIHYMNVVGSDKTGHAYVSNPLTGNVGRVPINSLTRNSILGLYGSGDSDFASKYHFSDDISDLMGSLRSLASSFLSMFTGKSEQEEAYDSSKITQTLKNIKAQLGADKYAEIEAQAKSDWETANPQMPGESDLAYKSRWEKNKDKFILKYSKTAMDDKILNSGHDPSVLQAADEELGWDDIFTGMENDHAASDEAASKWGNMVESVTAQAQGASGRGGSRLGKADLIKNTAMVYEAYIKGNSNGTYSNALQGPFTLRNGTVRKIRPDCTGLISAGIQELGYTLKGANEFGLNSHTFMSGGQNYENTLILDETGQPSADWIVLPFSPDVLEPGDITVKSGHASMPITNLTTAYPDGLDGGGTENIRESAKAAIAYLNGEEPVPWYGSAMGFGDWGDGSGQGAALIYRFLGRPGQGPVEMSDMMKQHDTWNSYKNKPGMAEFIQKAFDAGLTGAQVATILSTIIWEDSAEKVIGTKALNGITTDNTGQKAIGLMNWGDCKNHGNTVEEQLNYIRGAYFEEPYSRGEYATVRRNGFEDQDLAAYMTATGRDGWELNFGEYYSPFINTDLVEGSAHFFRSSLVPQKIHTALGMAENIGTAAGAYNWMIDEGMISSTDQGYIGGSTSISGVNTIYNNPNGITWDDIPEQARTGYTQQHYEEATPVKKVGAGTPGLYTFKNANNVPLFTAYDRYEMPSPALSSIENQYKERYDFTFDGKTYTIYGFSSSTLGAIAKKKYSKGGSASVGSSYKNDKSYVYNDGDFSVPVEAYYQPEYMQDGNIYGGSFNLNPTKEHAKTGGGKSRDTQILYGTSHTNTRQIPAAYGNINLSFEHGGGGSSRLYGSGDVSIPPIDENQTAMLNDLLGWQNETSQTPSVNQYYITQDSTKYEMIQAILHNTFEIKSKSIEAILNQILEEIRNRRGSTGTRSSNAPTVEDMFANSEIPPQIQRLARG